MIIICDICRLYTCPTACPSYEGKNVLLGDSVGECSVCGARVYNDDEHYTHDGKMLCVECAEELLSPELLAFFGCDTITEFFEMLY